MRILGRRNVYQAKSGMKLNLKIISFEPTYRIRYQSLYIYLQIIHLYVKLHNIKNKVPRISGNYILV